jgi:SPP1 gp7 family putative phage head morphogenesis protein
MQQATKEVVKKKFGRKQLLVSKVVPHYPENLEREYIRVTNAYMSLFKNTLAEHLPRIRAVLESNGVRQDADDEDQNIPQVYHTGAKAAVFGTAVEVAFAEVLGDFEKRQGLFGLQNRIEKLSNLSRKLTIAEWKRVVKRTLGIDILDDYYSGLKFQQLFDKWTAENVGLIKTIPGETLGKMKDIVKQGYLSGANTKSIALQIQQSYDVDKNHALFIARDQIAKLNAQITQEQQSDAGVKEYVWRTMNDGRVRSCHARLNNKRFKYSEPPCVDEKNGRYANPGEDYQCRCVALPVFDIEGVVLPWEKEAKESE